MAVLSPLYRVEIESISNLLKVIVSETGRANAVTWRSDSRDGASGIRAWRVLTQPRHRGSKTFPSVKDEGTINDPWESSIFRKVDSLIWSSLPTRLRLRPLILQIWKWRYRSPVWKKAESCFPWPHTHGLSRFRITAICDSSHHSLSNRSISKINLNYGWNLDSILESLFVIPVSLVYLTHPFLSFSTSEYTSMKTEIEIYIFFWSSQDFIH